MIGDDLSAAEELIAARGVALGRPFHLLDETESTNDDAKRAGKAGAPHGATWVAETQRAGRGRQGRAWLAREGENLLFSVLLRAQCAPARLPPIAIAAGLAVRDAVARAAPDATIGLKWPNDVVLMPSRKKLAGILVETTMSGARVDAVVIGVGINVHQHDFDPEIAERATSIACVARSTPSRAEILADALAALERDVFRVIAHGLGPLHARIAEVDVLRGEHVRTDGDEGRAEGIDSEGRLMVRRADGTLARWNAGEAHLVPAPR